MYEQVEKTKENKSRAVANSVSQKKCDVKQGFGFEDNRPETLSLRKMVQLMQKREGNMVDFPDHQKSTKMMKYPKAQALTRNYLPLQSFNTKEDTVVQRVVRISGKLWDVEMGNPLNNPSEEMTARYVQWRDDEIKRNFKNPNELSYHLKRSLGKDHLTADRETWWEGPDEGILELLPKDPLFRKIASECLQNHYEHPYSTDALHETGPITSGWMAGKGFKDTVMKMAPAIKDKSILVGKGEQDRPHIEITKIQMIKNKALLLDYEYAKREMLGRGQDPNERSLYSGHSTQGMNFITERGHDPSYGQYDKGMKGHGAHGRGAYFTDQVDKAISYSKKDQKEGEERSFFMQDVLLGNTFEYTERGRFRHQHHNEMTRTDRNPRNKLITEGKPEEQNLSRFDSLKGKKSSKPGAGLLGTWLDSNKFDSDEYMVRNADQIYVKFRIFYKLVDSPPLTDVKIEH